MSEQVTTQITSSLKSKVANFLEKVAHKLMELWWVDFAFFLAGALILLAVLKLRGERDEEEK